MYFSCIYRVKEGKVEKVRKWMKEVQNERYQEAIKTFEYEGVDREVFVLFEGNDERFYVLGLNEAIESPKPGDASVKINREHNSIKQECLEPFSQKGEVLLDLQK